MSLFARNFQRLLITLTVAGNLLSVACMALQGRCNSGLVSYSPPGSLCSRQMGPGFGPLC